MHSNRTYLKFAITCIVPVIVIEICLSPFWFAGVYADHAWLPTTQDLLTGVMLPLYLAIIGLRFIWKSDSKSTLYALGILLLSVLLVVSLDYTVWGVSTGRFWEPDGETVMLLTIIGGIALVITLIPQLVAILLKLANRHVK